MYIFENLKVMKIFEDTQIVVIIYYNFLNNWLNANLISIIKKKKEKINFINMSLCL